jgi:hypothetical protein
MKDSIDSRLLQHLYEVIGAHRQAFRQERTYQRAIGLILGELFTFARHTITQGLLALGLTDADWSAWYRLLSHGRFDAECASTCLLGETVKHVEPDEPYTIGVDGVQVPRSSLKMPGTSWLKASGTAAFKPGIHRAQRFMDLSWLVPQEGGFSRAIPLKWLAAYPVKAVPAAVEPQKDWEAAISGISWVRQQLDQLGRATQIVLVLADGGLERVVEFWKQLPGRTVLLGRTARNRILYEMPIYSGLGRPPDYGKRAPKPSDWLRQKQGFQTVHIPVRGRQREMTYRIEGPFLREGMPDRPVFLIAVKGIDRKINGQRVQRAPAFYLASAIQKHGQWQLPFSANFLLGWAWQRWELEVEHRELKSGFGLGEKQCWNPSSATVSVQWSAWVYALLFLAGYRTWGLLGGPSSPGRWWRGSRRWSFNTLWRSYRAALWSAPDFRAVWTGSGDNWLKKGDWIASLWNSALGSARS